MEYPNKTDEDPDNTFEFSSWSTPIIAAPAPSETNTTNSKVERHPEYYFDIVIFLVENQLFRVPRRNFATQSDIFSDMFQLPLPDGDGTSAEGLTDDRPIRLDGISRSSFTLLLRVMFPLDSKSCDSLSLEEWEAVLELSTMWQFQDIRTRAIEAMENVSLGMDSDPVRKIVVARKFDVSSWLVPSLNALVQRERPLDLSDGVRLGMEWALKVAEARECGATLLPGPNCSCGGVYFCDYCRHGVPDTTSETSELEARGDRTSVDYSDKIREIFDLPNEVVTDQGIEA